MAPTSRASGWPNTTACTTGSGKCRTAPSERAAIREMKRLFNAYMPYKIHGHRYVNDVSHPWLVGYRRHPFARDFFKYVDIDVTVRHAA